MRINCLLTSLILFASAVAACFGDGEPAAPAQPTIYLIGDSTVNNGTGGQMGWGRPFASWVEAERATLVNRARGGRSSRSFYREGLWDQVAELLKPGDVVLMQFGHNDGGSLRDPKHRASIKGNGEETQDVVNAETGETETVHSYGWYLRAYCAGALAKGATAVVLSMVPRNIWHDGRVDRAAAGYGAWAKSAAEQSGALFFDLNAAVADRYEQVGQQTVAGDYFGPTDHTHTTPAGAAVTAEVLAAGLRDLADFPVAGVLRATAHE